MDKPNEMVFTIEPYRKPCGNDDEALDLMWEDITRFLRVLARNDMVATVYDDDTDIIVVRYDYNDADMGGPMPFWLTPDEYEEMQTAFENLKCNCVAPEAELKEGYEYG